jgi:hypothetical protein
VGSPLQFSSLTGGDTLEVLSQCLGSPGTAQSFESVEFFTFFWLSVSSSFLYKEKLAIISLLNIGIFHVIEKRGRIHGQLFFTTQDRFPPPYCSSLFFKYVFNTYRGMAHLYKAQSDILIHVYHME